MKISMTMAGLIALLRAPNKPAVAAVMNYEIHPHVPLLLIKRGAYMADASASTTTLEKLHTDLQKAFQDYDAFDIKGWDLELDASGAEKDLLFAKTSFTPGCNTTGNWESLDWIAAIEDVSPTKPLKLAVHKCKEVDSVASTLTFGSGLVQGRAPLEPRKYGSKRYKLGSRPEQEYTDAVEWHATFAAVKLMLLERSTGTKATITLKGNQVDCALLNLPDAKLGSVAGVKHLEAYKGIPFEAAISVNEPKTGGQCRGAFERQSPGHEPHDASHDCGGQSVIVNISLPVASLKTAEAIVTVRLSPRDDERRAAEDHDHFNEEAPAHGAPRAGALGLRGDSLCMFLNAPYDTA